LKDEAKMKVDKWSSRIASLGAIIISISSLIIFWAIYDMATKAPLTTIRLAISDSIVGDHVGDPDNLPSIYLLGALKALTFSMFLVYGIGLIFIKRKMI
jgi:hypothetical protein